MKIHLRSLAALSILSVTLMACNAISTNEAADKAAKDVDQSAQTTVDSNKNSEDRISSAPASSDEEKDIEAPASSETTFWPDGEKAVDQQGAVEVVIVPQNLNAPQETLDFEVSLNTHSVDLSMDLAAVASLKTDTGLVLKASGWTGPSGGHHVNGILSFPASIDGEPVLHEVNVLEISIINLDAQERVFFWER